MYPNYPYFAVAITRTCGSGGGSYIGKKLAQDFDIDLYDRKLLRLAAEDSGINEKIFAAADENTKKTLLYRVSQHVYDGSFIPPESGNFISDQNLFNYQAKVLRELLDEESYVCVGRAADFVLKDKPNVLTVYINAPYEDRIEREMKRQGIGRSQAIRYIDKLGPLPGELLQISHRPPVEAGRKLRPLPGQRRHWAGQLRRDHQKSHRAEIWGEMPAVKLGKTPAIIKQGRKELWKHLHITMERSARRKN